MIELQTPPAAPPRPPAPLPAVPRTEPSAPWFSLNRIPSSWMRLFPGQVENPSSQERHHLLALLLLPALLLYPCMAFHLFEPDEGRYAQIPHEMLARGEWVVPTLQGKPYLDKPPLFYWCVMLSFAVLGYHDWAARLVPALATHGTLLLTYFLGRRLLGPRPAFWGSFFLMLAPGFLGISRLLLLDGLLTFLTTLALLAGYLAQARPRLHRGWWYLAALACGLGTLTKGPVALVLFLPPLWLVRRLEAQRCPLPWRHVLGFLGVVLAINVPWYAAILLREPEFAAHFFWQHNFQRFTEPFDHQRPFWFFIPLLLVGLLPASLPLVPAGRFLFSRTEADRRARPPALGFLLLAGGWCFLFFSLSGCKLPTYILPAFPPLALALGCFAARRWSDRVPRWAATALGGWFALLLVAHWVVVPWAAWARSPMDHPERVRAWCAETPVYCFPRPVDSAAFYLGRRDLLHFRSKDLDMLISHLEQHPRAVVLFSHRHSLDLLRLHLPPHLTITEEAPLGLCKMAKVVRRGKH